jgi:hypothetical protein
MSETVTLPLTATIPSYLYIEYNDDQDLQAFVDAYNQITQNYIALFNIIGLPVYTGNYIVSALLDWVGNGIYGLPRPVIPASPGMTVGLFNTFTPNEIVFNKGVVISPPTFSLVSDDIYKRVLTWILYRGDGTTFTVTWLKRRILRFLGGVNGIDFPIDDTSQVSVSFPGNHVIAIGVFAGAIDTSNFTLMAQAILAGILPLPFQYSVTVTLEDLLTNDGGVLLIAPGALYPTSATGTPGTFWSNGGVVTIVPGGTYSAGPPVYFSSVTANSLFAMGGLGLPTTGPTAGTGQLWLNSGEVAIA